MNTNKSKQQKSKTQKNIVKQERDTARLHPLFSGMFRTMFPHLPQGGK